MAQDNLWVNSGSGQLLDFNTGGVQAIADQLPTDPGTWRYHGQTAQYSENAQYDANGQLLFFVQDGNIYDHAGYLMADNDADPQNCRNCLVKGLQEILITPVPGTCDKYYIIGGNKAGNYSALGYSILDLAKPNPFFPGRLGAVWDLVDVQGQPVMDQQMQGSTPGITLPQLDLPSTCHLGSTGNTATRSKNAHLCILDGPANGEPRTLFVQTASSFKYATISANGISNLQVFRTFGNSSADDILHWSGGIAVAKTSPDNVVRLARTINSDLYPASSFNVSIEVSQVSFTGNQVSDVVLASINTDLTGTHQGIGTVHGIAFSPSGRYLYFSQATQPYIGYVDMLDPAYTVHDLVTELGLTGMSAYGNGQIACNKGPNGNGWSMYYPSATGMGCLNNIENPASLTWTYTLTVPGGPVAAPPNSVLSNTPGTPFNHYLMDRQNYRDQQLTNQGTNLCCAVNEMVPEGSHAYTYTGINTYSTAWTPANNPLTLPNASHVFFTEDFVVEAGARLYVQGMDWRFAPDAKLLIKAGAFVQFDNCTLEGSQCAPSRWEGVVVLGKPLYAQGTSSFPADQGRLVLNASTIKDALTGVLLGQKAAGGILNATGSTFLNCKVGVDFWPYQNFIAGNGMHIANRSTLVSTTFTVDAQYPATIDFLAHAKLWKVDGIRFIACTFQNLRTTELNSLQLGQGIYSLDANFSVIASCSLPPGTPPPCLPPYLHPSRFIGMDHGIDARKVTTDRNFEVKQARFESNVCGVYANTINGYVVKQCNFKLGEREVALTNPDELYWQGAYRGIYSVNSSGFTVDDNTLVQDGPHTQTEGIVIGYSMDYNDIVFRNHATGLESGFIGEGICASTVAGFTSTKGLQFLCNQADDCNNDFWCRLVTSDPGNQNEHTIRLNQGSPNRPADNSFDEWPLASANLDFKVTTTNDPIQYWGRNVSPYVPINYTVGPHGLVPHNVLTIPINNCASKFITIADPQDPDELNALITDEKLAYGNTAYLYENLIDDGNTDEVVEEIEESWPQDAWALHDYLMGKSPNLSVTALRKAVLKDIMPDAMLTEVLTANPGATRSQGFLNWLQNESGHPLPDYLVVMVVASWDQSSYRDVLLGEMGQHSAQMGQAACTLVQLYRADTTGVPLDSVAATWQQLKSIAARYAEAFTRMEQGYYAAATAAVDSISLEHELSVPEQQEQQRMLDLIAFLQNLPDSNRAGTGLDSSQVAALQAMMGDAHDRAASGISNLLCFGYGICRPSLTGGDAMTPRSLHYITTDPVAAASPALSVYPNPASSFATLAWDMHTTLDRACLLVRDLTGRELQRFPLFNTKGQQLWDTRPVLPGAYTVELRNADATLGTAKVVVKP
ncbi:MAG: hypothetical protein IT230_13900 [Flavobacteriales bacterium]|nr:hypothetical protein [Flavobacteriales bacterium]